MTSSERQHIEDPVYGRYFKVIAPTQFDDRAADNPFTAPTSILGEFLASADLDALQSEPIDADLTALVGREGNRLLHALGTWHVAERALEFGRIVVMDHGPDDFPGPEAETLARRLVYGDGVADTLLEEFCIAAFFQAYFDERPAHDAEARRSRTRAALDEILSSNQAFRRYQEANRLNISLDVVAYWVDGLHLTFEDAAFEKVRAAAGPGGDEARGARLRNHIERVRALYFSPSGPLNLAQLDLLSRVGFKMVGDGGVPSGWARHLHDVHNDPQAAVMGAALRGFLDRLRIAPQVGRTFHLLADPHWAERSPYFVPTRDDVPLFGFLEPYIGALETVRTSPAVGRSPHPLFGRSDPDQEELQQPKGGFLRLSLSGPPFSEEMQPYYDRMRTITGA